MLALHAMNSSPTSDDFLMSAELQMTVPTEIQAEVPRYFASPTPGGPNGMTSYGGLVAPVSVDIERGFYDQAFDVNLTSSTPGASLIYTTDGSVPSPENGVVVPPFSAADGASTRVRIAKTTTLRVGAFKDDFLASTINTQTYIMLADVLTQDVQATLDAGFPETWGRTEPDYGVDPDVVGPNDQYDGEFASQILTALKAVPTVSVVMDMDDLFGPEGIYINSTRSGPDWERLTSFEFINPDGSGSVQADAGVRIQGDNVRNFSNSKKQSFRFEFRGQYGPTKLRFPVFGSEATDSFDTLILRGGYNDAWVHTPNTTQYIRDQWARTTLLAMGQPQVHGQFVHVYLNGFYWGMYNLVERPNASFSASYSGGDKDQWDTLNTGVVRDGTRDAWASLLSLSRGVDDADAAASNAAYLRLLGKNADGTPNPATRKVAGCRQLYRLPDREFLRRERRLARPQLLRGTVAGSRKHGIPVLCLGYGKDPGPWRRFGSEYESCWVSPTAWRPPTATCVRTRNSASSLPTTSIATSLTAARCMSIRRARSGTRINRRTISPPHATPRWPNRPSCR